MGQSMHTGQIEETKLNLFCKKTTHTSDHFLPYVPRPACPAMPCHALPCPVKPCHVLLSPAMVCPALPCPTNSINRQKYSKSKPSSSLICVCVCVRVCLSEPKCGGVYLNE